MRLDEYIDPELLRQRIEQQYVRVALHPDDPTMRLYCYTHIAQYDAVWDDATMRCRGLITHGDEIVARPWPKFFSYEQHFNVWKRLPQGNARVTEKLDGSLGIMYRHPLTGRPQIATKGSFASDQAQWATKWLSRQRIEFDATNTYLFEIIYPANRIVVPYDYSGLVLLDVLQQGQTNHVELQRLAVDGWRTPTARYERMDLTTLSTMYQQVADNEEGYVLVYDNGVRIKVKGEEYLRLHRIVTGMTPRTLHAELQRGGLQSVHDLIAGMPDEFYTWADGVAQTLQQQYESLRDVALAAYGQVRTLDRRDAAAVLKRDYVDVQGVVFSMLDNKIERATEQLWKQVRPDSTDVWFGQADG